MIVGVERGIVNKKKRWTVVDGIVFASLLEIILHDDTCRATSTDLVSAASKGVFELSSSDIPSPVCPRG